jgi:DNA (cytosine-5)-methyltransferase 1
MRVLDLFSGIGGFSLGLERAGMRTVAFCEINQSCRRTLARHWPGVPIYHDIRSLTAERLAADGIGVDIIAGGFPCQDISLAGEGAGLAGERSGLWWEYARLIEEIGPRWAIIENVAALRTRGLDVVLGTLAAIGYDAEWHCISAASVGAPHIRERVWILANSKHDRRERMHAQWPGASAALPCRAHVADAKGAGLPQRLAGDASRPRPICGTGLERSGWWAVEPDVGRVANAVPGRVDRLRALGNAVVPEIPRQLGAFVLAADRRQRLANDLSIKDGAVRILNGVAGQHGGQGLGGDSGSALLANLPSATAVHFDNDLCHGAASLEGPSKAKAALSVNSKTK